jgi:hypothetical protein
MSKVQNDFYVENNVVRWNSSNNVPFDDKLTEFLICGLVDQETVLKSMKVRKVEDLKFLTEYVANRKQYGYSDEEKFEMQSAFAGEAVVDIFTGQIVQYA